MMWFRVDDSFQGHPKAVGLCNDSLATWTRAGEWCAWQLTDGVFDEALLPMFAGDADDPDAVRRDLLDRRLWEPADSGGLQFHDWTDWNPSRAQVLARRERDAKRYRTWNERRKANAVDNTVSNAVSDTVSDTVSNAGTNARTNAVANAASDPTTRPDPTRRVGVGSGEETKGSDRNARERTASGSRAPADDEGWTPHSALDTPERPRRGTRTTHPNVQAAMADTHRPGGPSPDAPARAAEARAQLLNRPSQLAPADEPEPDEATVATGRGLHGEDLARAQLAASRAARLPETPPAPEDDPNWEPPY